MSPSTQHCVLITFSFAPEDFLLLCIWNDRIVAPYCIVVTMCSCCILPHTCTRYRFYIAVSHLPFVVLHILLEGSMQLDSGISGPDIPILVLPFWRVCTHTPSPKTKTCHKNVNWYKKKSQNENKKKIRSIIYILSMKNKTKTITMQKIAPRFVLFSDSYTTQVFHRSCIQTV